MIKRMKFHKLEKKDFMLWTKAQQLKDWVFEIKEDGVQD